MSDNKREQERTELYRTIWALANELRGSVDGWDFKQYVLGMLFYRYISENLTTYLNKGEWDARNTDFDYSKISDEEASAVRDEMVQVKGFFILPSELFGNLLNRIKKADKDAKDKAEKDGKEVEIADLDEHYLKIFTFYRLGRRCLYQNKQQKHAQFFRSRPCFCFLFCATNVSGGHFFEKMETITSKTILCSHE